MTRWIKASLWAFYWTTIGVILLSVLGIILLRISLGV